MEQEIQPAQTEEAEKMRIKWPKHPNSKYIIYPKSSHLTGSIQRDPHRETSSNSCDLKKKEENLNATSGEGKSPVL